MVQLTELQYRIRIKEIKIMANCSLVTVKKGNITTVDGFIKTFNTIGHNMKVLAVSAYGFLTSEDKDLSIEFGKRVRDELNMSKATLSNLRTAGWLYSLSDIFEQFSYTNVVLFKKNVEELKDENGVIDLCVLYKFIIELAITADGFMELKCDNLEDDAKIASDFLATFSQKDLKHLIEVYNTPIAEATIEDVEETEETAEETEETEDVIDLELEEVEYDDPRITMYKDDIVNTLNILGAITSDMTKNNIMTEITKAIELLGNAYDRTQDK